MSQTSDSNQSCAKEKPVTKQGGPEKFKRRMTIMKKVLKKEDPQTSTDSDDANPLCDSMREPPKKEEPPKDTFDFDAWKSPEAHYEEYKK